MFVVKYLFVSQLTLHHYHSENKEMSFTFKEDNPHSILFERMSMKLSDCTENKSNASNNGYHSHAG